MGLHLEGFQGLPLSGVTAGVTPGCSCRVAASRVAPAWAMAMAMHLVEELTREQIQAKIKRMSRKIASLKKKSEKSKNARDITSTRLNFEGENGRKEDGNPEKEANAGENDKEHSPAASLNAFVHSGKRLTEHDLRHWLDTEAAHKDKADGSQSGALPSQRKETLPSQAKS